MNMDMNDIRGTIDRLEYETMALEKQAFFENEVGIIRDWFVDNKDCLLDSARSISDNWFDDCKEDEKMDKVDLDFMIEGFSR